jgi:hypothetical protein
LRDVAPCSLIDTDVSEVFITSIIRTIIVLMTDVVSISEISVDFYKTARRVSR